MRLRKDLHRQFGPILIVLGIFLLGSARSQGAEDPKPAVDKAPSKDKIQWTGTQTSLETVAQFDYVAGGSTGFGNGQEGNVAENQVMIRQIVTERCWRAFLLHGGFEWERFAFDAPDNAYIPQHLHVLNAYLAADFRFSYHDMIRIQAMPGLYSDYESVDMSDVNTPWAVAYSRMVSRNFQFALGISVNQWRNHPILGGGGFRWQINDRWKLKMMLPEPRVEYRAREDLHLFAGGDFRGDTYRVSSRFGTRRGNPEFDNAIVDYQEIRVGAGFSWNIKPLFEMNVHSGYMVDRAFHFHNNGFLLTSSPSPYVTVNFTALFEVPHEGGAGLDTERQQFQIPDLDRIFPKVVPKVMQQ